VLLSAEARVGQAAIARSTEAGGDDDSVSGPYVVPMPMGGGGALVRRKPSPVCRAAAVGREASVRVGRVGSGAGSGIADGVRPRHAWHPSKRGSPTECVLARPLAKTTTRAGVLAGIATPTSILARSRSRETVSQAHVFV
jgi:hypothetical protein